MYPNLCVDCLHTSMFLCFVVLVLMYYCLFIVLYSLVCLFYVFYCLVVHIVLLVVDPNLPTAKGCEGLCEGLLWWMGQNE